MSAIQLFAASETNDSPLGCEETELCIRAQTHLPPGRFLTEPRAVVHQAVPAERMSWPYCCAHCRVGGISKARVARNVGRTAALSAECACVRRVLPIGVQHNLARGLHGDLAAPARASAIVVGLAFTATGLLKIRWTRPAGPPQVVGSTLRDLRAGRYAPTCASGPWGYRRSRHHAQRQAVG